MLASRRLRELDLEKVILIKYCEIKDGVRKTNLGLGLHTTNLRTKKGQREQKFKVILRAVVSFRTA